ncbi:LysR family transcriptional regulator ArgP [Cellulomonas chengniuliangii]|uniref:LysR family transcriptional regulator ArgP n=1 Tax=Cellulomonas chengniuliangii TaxID=2968084 RepID=UPI001D0ED516|nr:LysR family transcriptional regulator ArgP [Cellulomonas chengniuliangii]MCC2318955.1 LysR family transcriptional regulator ArgP [Cellulomonas chengniuliangii]
MSYPPEQLAALAAVVSEGTFDAAARQLHVTPSAVSQRVKSLEEQVGRILVLRSRPCRATPEGEVLVRLAGQVGLLAADARAQLGADRAATVRLAVAVNADSLSTWFPAALVDLPEGVLVDLHRQDQDRSAQLLRDGAVMAAVTADPRAVQGCRVRPLGSMRYLAVAAPSTRQRWFADGLTRDALAVAPQLAFDRVDALQRRFIADVAGEGVVPPVHHVPSSSAFLEVLRSGLGWGMAPEQAVADDLAAGALAELAAGRWLDVPLCWQSWSLRTPTLDALTARVVAAAASALRPASAF